MMRRAVTTIRVYWRCILIGAALISTVTSLAFVSRLDPSNQPLRWDFDHFVDIHPPPDQNPVTLAIRFHLPQTGWSVENSARELDAIRAAFAQWQMIPGTRIKFEESTTLGTLADVNAE